MVARNGGSSFQSHERPGPISGGGADAVVMGEEKEGSRTELIDLQRDGEQQEFMEGIRSFAVGDSIPAGDIRLGRDDMNIPTPSVDSGGHYVENEGELDEEVDDLAPEHACRYCGASDPSTVVRCIESGMWFCNGSGKTTASHIVHHLVRSKNKEICLHPESPLEDTVVECYNCGNRNLFTMGFIPAKDEAVVVLLCRNCLGNTLLKELGWSIEHWTPLVQDRQLISWLVKVPDASDVKKNVTTGQINRLEDLWKTKPYADLNELDGPNGSPEEEVIPAKKVYEDGYDYEAIFKPLVELEADFDRQLKSKMSVENLSLRWKTLAESSGCILAVIERTPAMKDLFRVTIGDEIRLQLSKSLMPDSGTKEVTIVAPLSVSNGGRNRATLVETGMRRKDWQGVGLVINSNESEIVLELEYDESFPTQVTSGYGFHFVWKSVTFDRMNKALKSFADVSDSVSGYIYHKLLGHEIPNPRLAVDLPSRFSVDGLPELNESQIDAIRQVLPCPLALIQGPPGTGKTVTAASLVYHMVNNNKNQQVLVCAPSNVAVDHLTNKIRKTGLSVVRVCAKTREHIQSNIEHLALHNKILEIDSKNGREYRRLLKKQELSGHRLRPRDLQRLMRLRQSLETEVINAAQVVCSTCSGVGSSKLRSRVFSRVLLDEATQATEPESLIPVVLGCKQFVLVGDHCQLGPVVMCKKAANAGLASSLFERLVTVGLRPIRLAIQYRMHPCLSEFPSNIFYEGSLQNGVSVAERTDSITFPWPDSRKPMFFLSCLGAEELSSSGTSYLNRSEAKACEAAISKLIKCGVSPSQIGVITPYEGQRSYINSQLCINHVQAVNCDIEVASVDAFQGREKDYVILSCVRSNEKQGIGFLADSRRLNVALTRAKYGMIILGNPMVLAKQPLWNALVNHFKSNQLVMEGTIGNMEPTMMKFPKLKKFRRDRRQLEFEASALAVFSGDVLDPYGSKNFNAKDFPAWNDDSGNHNRRHGGDTHSKEKSGKDAFNIDVSLPVNTSSTTTTTAKNMSSSKQMDGSRLATDELAANFIGTDPLMSGEGVPGFMSAFNAGHHLGVPHYSDTFTQAVTSDSPFTQMGGFASQSEPYLTQQMPESQVSRSPYIFGDD